MKNKIDLQDYSYKQDIEFRLMLSELTVFEVQLIEEILHHSLKIPIFDLQKALHVNYNEILPVLQKLLNLKLFKINKDTLEVNKEMRKYYEGYLAKFTDTFNPDLEYLRTLLNKLPIHVLPQWYAISRSSDDIFQSIIEKYFESPKQYQKYLHEIEFDEPILKQMQQMIFSAPDYKVYAKELQKKFKLTREELEEAILHLEYNFVCCLSYDQVGDVWEEVVTPYYEWKQYLQFLDETKPTKIEKFDEIERIHSEEFGFIEEMKRCLKDQKHPNEEIKRSVITFNLAEKNGKPTLLGKGWLNESLQEQAMTLYRLTDRETRLYEKSLNRVVGKGWIYFDDFIKGLIIPKGNFEGVSLQRMGKRWKYTIPSYSQEEIDFLETDLRGRLYQMGLVDVGTHEGKFCFSITPFGKTIL